jgi:hypothetical protein
MSRNHPNNGPSLSAAPLKKRKPMTDQELADWQAMGKVRMEETIRRADRAKNSSKLRKAKKGNDHGVLLNCPREAFEYEDDVTPEAIAQLRAEADEKLPKGDWTVIDGYVGQGKRAPRVG